MKKVLILIISCLFIFTACSSSTGGDSNSDVIKKKTDTETAPETNGQSSDDSNNDDENSKVVTYLGTKTPAEAKEVGDIVFKDGSATPYTSELSLSDDQKTAVIAIIFYKGSGLNSDIYKGTNEAGDTAIWETGDTTTVRTLGVGLIHKQLYWCRWSNPLKGGSANASSKNIPTIQCPSYNDSGILTFTGDKNGKDNLAQIAELLGEEWDDTNTEIDNYPAFHFAINYKNEVIGSEEISRILGTSYENEWYFPTIAEMYEILKIKDRLNSIINLCDGNTFESEYLSSSQTSGQYHASSADTINFKECKCSYYNREHYPRMICAIREF